MERSPAALVLVNWNSGDLVLAQLRELEGLVGAGLRVVVVDNASADRSGEQIANFLREWPEAGAVTLLRNSENLGYAAAVNQASAVVVQMAPPAEYLWTLNPDNKVDQTTLAELVEVSRESGAAIVSVAGPPWYIASRAWPRAFYAPPGSWRRRHPRGRRWWRAGNFNGSCAILETGLVRRLMERDGYLIDPGLFMDWDEWDCTLRAAPFGAWVAVAGNARHIHDDSSRTTGTSSLAAARQYYQSRNAIVVARRNMPPWQFWIALPIRFLRDFSWFLRLRLRGLRPNELAYLYGAVDAFRGRMGRWKHHPASR